MPRSETVLQVLVASPSDVSEEREILETVITELNRTWSKTLGVRLELIRWETTTHPAIGSDAQSVINAQIGDDYDVFIGIIWGRIGSETPRSESGTLEEFERAHSRWKADPQTLEIMFYFKDAPIRPSDSDGAQINKVQQFKRSLGEKGGYHWTFEDPANFESSVRAHLSSVAQRWEKGAGATLEAKVPKAPDSTELSSETGVDSDDDLGFLDYFDRFNLSIEKMQSGLKTVADATVSVGEHTKRRTAEMREIGDIDDPQRYKDARRTIKSSSEDLSRFADTLDGQLPLLTTSRKEAFESLSKALSLRKDFTDDDRDELDDLDSALRTMVESAGGALESMDGFRTSIRGLPRLTSGLNKAKRRVVKSLDQICSEIEAIISTAESLRGSLS